MENNENNEQIKKDKEQKSRNRLFGLMVFICLVLLAGIIYEVITLVQK